MYRILPLLGDAGLGILSIVFLSHWYSVSNMYAFLLLPLAFAPDLDAIVELRRRGKVAASAENPSDHREVLHKPILWMLVTGAWWYFGGFYGAVAFALVTMHFLHDSVLTGWGVPWLAPFLKVRIKFFASEANQESLAQKDWIRTWGPEELQKAIVAHGNENWIRDLYLRPTVVSIVEYGVFGLSLIALLWHLLA